MLNIDDKLKSCSEKNDVYVYSFSSKEVKEINEALMRKDLVEEIKRLVREENL